MALNQTGRRFHFRHAHRCFGRKLEVPPADGQPQRLLMKTGGWLVWRGQICLLGDSRSPSAPGALDPAGSVAAPPHPTISRLAPNQGSSSPTCAATPPPESFNPNVDIDKTNYNVSLRLRGLARGPADRPARPTRAGQDPLASCQNCFEKNLGSDPVAPRHSNSARSLAHCQPSAPACQRSGSRCRRSQAIRQGFAGGAPTPRPIVLIDAVKWRY